MLHLELILRRFLKEFPGTEFHAPPFIQTPHLLNFSCFSNPLLISNPPFIRTLGYYCSTTVLSKTNKMIVIITIIVKVMEIMTMMISTTSEK